MDNLINGKVSFQQKAPIDRSTIEKEREKIKGIVYGSGMGTIKADFPFFPDTNTRGQFSSLVCKDVTREVKGKRLNA
jgi:hypothetical protein